MTTHIISATALATGEQLSMCGDVFPTYDAAVSAGHKVGNYLNQRTTLAAYHAAGVDCDSCIVRHQNAGH